MNLDQTHYWNLKHTIISVKQTLEIMEKLSPEIRDDYEEFLLLKTQNESNVNITKIKKFKTTSLLKKYLKNYKNI